MNNDSSYEYEQPQSSYPEEKPDWTLPPPPSQRIDPDSAFRVEGMSDGEQEEDLSRYNGQDYYRLHRAVERLRHIHGDM